MFEMTSKELEIWRSQIATSNSDILGLRHLPYCFTEQGVAQLSTVLNSEKAIIMNIQIIRIFTKLRQSIATNEIIKIEIELIKNKLNNHDKNIELVFQYLDELFQKKEMLDNREFIGFKNDEQNKAVEA